MFGRILKNVAKYMFATGMCVQAAVSTAVAAPGDISTVAGDGAPVYAGDGGPATQASLNNPWGVAADGNGNLFIVDHVNARIRRVDAETGVITTVAGAGDWAYSGDGGPATEAALNFPSGAFVDGDGDLYIADQSNNRVRRVDGATGMITTVAGNGTGGFSGDGGPATEAALNLPTSVHVDGSGNLYIADQRNARVRRVTPDGTISTVAGNGVLDFSGDGGPATEASLSAVDVFVDGSGNLYIADQSGQRIRRVAPDGTIATVAGSGVGDYSGDGGPATEAGLASPLGVVVDGAGNLFIADALNNRIRRVDGATGIITTIAGSGGIGYDQGGYSGDGGPALEAEINGPQDVTIDKDGNLYLSGRENHRVRRIEAAAVAPGTQQPGNGGSEPGDTEGPFVVESSPEDGAANVNPNTVNANGIVVTFNEAIDVSAIGVAVMVEGNDLDWTSAWSEDSRVLTLRPDGEELEYESAYVVQLSGAADEAGNEAGLIAIAFTTGARPAPPPGAGNRRATVVSTVLRDGEPAAGLEISFSRSISGRRSDYRWSGVTDAQGRVEVEITADEPQFWRTGVSGYYLARAVDAAGEVVARWNSIPINGGQAITVSLEIGGRALVTGSNPLEAPVRLANYPNPFNPRTQIAYTLPEAGEVSLVIYNSLGQRVRVLVREPQAAGSYRVMWDGRDALGRSVASGVYFYRLAAGAFSQVRRMVLLK